MTDRETWKTTLKTYYHDTVSNSKPDVGLECPTCGTKHHVPHEPRTEPVDLNYYPEGYLPGNGPTLRYL